jgi:hypothetical protein
MESHSLWLSFAIVYECNLQRSEYVVVEECSASSAAIRRLLLIFIVKHQLLLAVSGRNIVNVFS